MSERDNAGALFKNDKGDNDKRPDYRGDCLIDGMKYEIAAWIKQGAKGKFMSLSFKPKEQERRTGNPPVSGMDRQPLDDEIPF